MKGIVKPYNYVASYIWSTVGVVQAVYNSNEEFKSLE